MSENVILVNQHFKNLYPFIASKIYSTWSQKARVDLIEHSKEDVLSEVLAEYKTIKRLIILQTKISENCLKSDLTVEEMYIETSQQEFVSEFKENFKNKGCEIYVKKGEGHWGQSVSEFALALTLCGLRQIPLASQKMKTSNDPWDYHPKFDQNGNYIRAYQFCDDVNFTSGTIKGKKVRIVGAGNIASRYASFMAFLGADVASWDPFASDPCFHRSGAKRVNHLEDLITDAEIFVPMLPLTPNTKGLIEAKHVALIPKGTLIVMVTRAGICDTNALYERVKNKELFLAADVFDKEPVPFDHHLMNADNTVLTPHMAGRTMDANITYADEVMSYFKEFTS